MNITKRITKFLLIAALAIPAWNSLSAQNRTAPPENQVLEEAQSRSVAKRNADSRPFVKKEGLKVSTSSTTPELTSSAIASPSKGRKEDKIKTNGSKREGAVNAPNRAGTVVSIPSGATIEEWNITTEWHKYDGSDWTTPTFSSTVKVGFYGDDIYIAGLCDVFPDSWVKGTITGTTAKFASGQYYGASSSNEYWFVGEDSDDNEVDYVEFTYDASKHKLVLQTYSINNKDAETGGLYYSWHANTVIEKPTGATIANGTGTNNIVPVYGWYHDISSNTSQMIYPGTYLSDIPNKALIKSITFYTNSSGIKFGSSTAGVLTATIGTTTQSQFSSASLISITGTTSTATATPVYGETSLTFTFGTPFQYTTGDNLIIQTVNTTTGTCDPSSSDVTYWLGVSGSTPFGYNNKKGATQSFMPKMYVDYEMPEATYEATLTGDGDFGVVKVGETATATFVVTNEGSTAFTPVVTATGNGFTVTSTGSGQLASGATRNYTVTFAPTAVQNYSGTLTLTAQESEASAISASADLSGTGVNEETVTVADGTVTGKLPVFLYYLDAQNHGQMIYPADSLGLTTGTLIKSISFYSNADLTGSSGSSNNTITLKLGETSQSTYSSVDFLTGLTTVATLTSSQLLNGTTVATFTFNTPYEYHGGNLVVDASCPAVDGGYYTSSSTYWVGKTVTGAGVLYMYYSSTSANNVNAVQNFMPKMTMVVEMAAGTPTTELDFGTVEVGSPKTMIAYIDNPTDSEVTATVSVEPNPPFSVASTTVTLAPNATTPVSVTFNPEGALSYTGTLTVVAGDVTTTIPLRGVGTMSGPEAIRDEAFFEGIEYTWTDSEGTHTSTLADIATEPEQIIAMIKEIYTNKDIPGNYTRGFTSAGAKDVYADVNYAGVGTIDATVTSSTISYSYEDGYGWNIPGNLKSGNDGYYYYCYMDSTQYKPNNEGVTLLLVEINDVFDNTSVQASSKTLKEYIQSAIKSVRVVTQAKRTGTGYNKGTLFNIDCDKMNKFYFMAKGQLRWLHNSYWAADELFSANPCYIYDNSSSGTLDNFYDDRSFQIFYNMFEEFSPVVNTSSAALDDIYKDLVNMDSFSVVHDCMGVPYMGHQFEMYGSVSEAADCQDVRDLMFFVPDYRMMYWSGRDNSNAPKYQRYMNYNQSHAPTMGLYVIIQDTVEAVTRADDYFKLKLTWDSNMDEFMPSDQQEYQLYQVVTDEFGVSSWEPVYYTKVVNNQVVYTDENGNVVDTPVPIVLTMNPSSSKKTYTEVYVPRADASTEVTYAIRGQDTGHFLSLQMSNEQSYVIPGKDPAEMVLMSSATVYSRYEAQNENNCYSNKIQMKVAPRTIKASYLPNGSTMTLNRSYSKVENGATVTVTEPIATLTINTGTKKFTISGSVLNDVESYFPKGTHDGKTAGYHANSSSQISYTTQTSNGTEYINFDLTIWDNFVANVSNNEHPGLYTYQLKFTTAENFTGLNGTTNEAYSNPIRVFVYKTDSQVNEPLTLEQVKGDTDCKDAYTPGDVEFSAQVQLSGKSEILRYDAYRWVEGATRSIIYDGGLTDEDEDDVDPNGMAGNQGDSYTVSMNEVGTDDYYVGSAVPVTETAPLNWAKFVDYYPATLTDGGAFTYAPVVELFTKGYQAGSTTAARGDYNTYGGPLKTTAVGKLELEIPADLNTAANPFMSTYKWRDGDDWCAYYKIPVKFKALGIPEGYELYKVRAWRDVDTDILREELTERQDRIAANYLFEDLTYGDALGDGHTMSKANLFQNNDGTINSYELGRRPVENTDPNSNIQGETHATFGALRLDTKDDQPSSIKSLEATIKVRAYFTKTSNPILSDPIYVICDTGVKDENNNSWGFSNPVGTLICEDGANFTGTVTIPEGADGSHKGYFMFSKQLGSSWTNNPQYIFGPEASGNEVLGEWPNNAGYNLKYWQGGTKVFEVYPGTYKLSIGSHVQDLATSAQYGYQAGYITITRVANSKAPTRDLVPADYGYYVAEGEVEFNSNMFNQIITGVTDVTMNATREVMSVSYVNTIGQVSSTPWKGVNMVVTRYTDGSTSTTKVMK